MRRGRRDEAMVKEAIREAEYRRPERKDYRGFTLALIVAAVILLGIPACHGFMSEIADGKAWSGPMLLERASAQQTNQ